MEECVLGSVTGTWRSRNKIRMICAIHAEITAAMFGTLRLGASEACYGEGDSLDAECVGSLGLIRAI